jgi:polysaccharide export outer membrane protein
MMLKYLTGLLAAILLMIPALAGAAGSGYKIQPGDTLQLEVVQDSSLNRQLLVLPDGSVTVPMVGTIAAAGHTVDEVRATITQGLASSFTSKPAVYLSVAAIPLAANGGAAKPSVSIYVMGEVNKPGAIEVLPGTTLIQALATSGGFTNFAATRRLELLRLDRASGRQQVYDYDYRALTAGPSAPAVVLREGDVIVVPQRKLFE